MVQNDAVAKANIACIVKTSMLATLSIYHYTDKIKWCNIVEQNLVSALVNHVYAVQWETHCTKLYVGR